MPGGRKEKREKIPKSQYHNLIRLKGTRKSPLVCVYVLSVS